MEIEILEDTLISQLRSSTTIESVSQCVTELVLNSLDAKASAIAIRINLALFRIQVVDNGKGISRTNLDSVGNRYMTNKCHNLDDLKRRLRFYGFKGEALASITKICEKLVIITRQEHSEETYLKKFERNEEFIETAKARASHGTTVTVEGFLNNLPVRQQCIKNKELDSIRKSIESLVIIHPKVSFTLRNDLTGTLILSSPQCSDIASSFTTIHSEIDSNNFSLFKVSKNKITVEGLINKDLSEKRYQYVYVNKRPIYCTKIQNVIASHFRKIDKKKHPVYVLHVKCPYSDIDFTLEPSKTLVFFKKFDVIQRCIEKLLDAFSGTGQSEPQPKRVRSEFGISQIAGAVKGWGVKRKSNDVENISAEIVEDTPFFEEPKIPNKKSKVALPIEITKPCDFEEDLADKSLFTNFPENEQRGKNVIMDIFIKSLKVFPAEVEKNEEATGNTVGTQTEQDFCDAAVQTEDSSSLHDITFMPKRPLPRFVSDYNFDFSNLQNVRTKRQFSSRFENISNFERTTKLFDFRNFEQSYFCPNDMTRENFDMIEYSPFQVQSLRNSVIINHNNNSQILDETKISESPYFSQRNKEEISFLNQTNIRKYFKKSPSVFKAPLPKIQTDHVLDVEVTEKLSESIITESPYFQQKNAKQSLNKMKKPKTSLNVSSVSKYFNNSIHSSKEESEDLFSSALHKFERKISQNTLTPTLTVKNSNKKNIHTPKDLSFAMIERFEFVPKGLSPILKDHGKVDELSPGRKEVLQDAIINSYDDELLIIKWKNYIDNKDPGKFFEEIYLEKSKLIENPILNIHKSSLAKHAFKGFENMSFSKNLFANLEIIGQMDCKFITVFEKSKKLLLLFDQHAVHERVRLEELCESKNKIKLMCLSNFSDYKDASINLNENITIFLPHSDLNLLKEQKYNLGLMGLQVNFFSHGITIYEVPLCLYNKSTKGVDILLLTQSLIKEIIEILKENNGIIVKTPKLIQDIVNSEACRGAIKFGEPLTKNECIWHIKKLSDCSLPFQCAHGRPTLTPLMFLNKNANMVTSKPNLSRLLNY